mmetsp:Transcript_36954/g.99558  ORF Transcript_36954/g.99558 Transcript_36954/m.99558 type:complete len:361 (+) Transcript_36954:906-1988(+)
MGGFLIPVPMQAKWTVARSRTFSETKWKNVLIHTVKLNLLNFGIIVHMVGFLYDRFFLANSTNFWVTMLVRPLVINGVRWGVAHSLWILAANVIASPIFKLEILPQSFIITAFMSTLTISNSNDWPAASANMAFDWLMFFGRCYKLSVLYMPVEERRKSRLSTYMYREYTKDKSFGSFKPLPGMDVKHLRGFETQAASVGLTSALLAMCMTYVVLERFLPDSVVTNLFFGDDRERRIDKFWFLLAALVQDTAQDLVITRYVRHLTGVHYSRFFATPFSSWGAFGQSLSVRVCGGGFIGPILITTYGLCTQSARGYFDSCANVLCGVPGCSCTSDPLMTPTLAPTIDPALGAGSLPWPTPG